MPSIWQPCRMICWYQSKHPNNNLKQTKPGEWPAPIKVLCFWVRRDGPHGLIFLAPATDNDPCGASYCCQSKHWSLALVSSMNVSLVKTGFDSTMVVDHPAKVGWTVPLPLWGLIFSATSNNTASTKHTQRFLHECIVTQRFVWVCQGQQKHINSITKQNVLVYTIYWCVFAVFIVFVLADVH